MGKARHLRATRGGGGGGGICGHVRECFDGIAAGSCQNVSSGMAYFTSQDKVGYMSPEQREGMDCFLASETRSRHIVVLGDPSKIFYENPSPLS